MLLAALLLCLLGCTNTIIAPPDPVDPVSVYLIDYGRHSSLLLPDGDADAGAGAGAFIEYAYGDWNWFALDKSDVLDLFPTLLWPTRGALGRWPWPPKNGVRNRFLPETIRRDTHCQHVLEIVVPSRAVAAQLQHLDQRFRANIHTLHYQPLYRLDFVHDEQPYHVFHNCNHLVVQWLENLGCEVRGTGIFAVFRLQP